MIVQHKLLSFKNLHRCSKCCLHYAISVPKKNTICTKNMMHDIIFFMFELFSLLVPFSPLEYLLYKKYCTTTKGVHSASCKNIASWPRPHLFPHWPASFTLTDLSGNTCLFSRFKRSCMEVVHVISLF